MTSETALLKILNFFLVLSFCTVILTLNTFAQSSAELDKKISDEKGRLEEVNKSIKEIETNIAERKQVLAGATSEVDIIQAEIEINLQEVNLLKLQIEKVVEQGNIKRRQLEENETARDAFVQDSYLTWKQNTALKNIFSSEGENLLKVATYQNTVTEDKMTQIESISGQIDGIEKEMGELKKNEAVFESKISELNTQIAAKQQQLQALKGEITAGQQQVNSFRAQASQIQSSIDQLTKEQKAIQEKERQLLVKAKEGGTKELAVGDFYFQGVGREIYQGHGVGMSQFGALGAALNGWDYKKILQFYYPGTQISQTSRSDISVSGHGNMSIEDYAAGAGEIPDKSCEELDIEFDKNNVWKCWPEEAIKAQVVAFRTYGIHSTKDGSSICTTAACQVFKGGNNKKWAAKETEGEVVTYNGEAISAFYSSDNHNGWGTANNDTVWSDFSGVGVPKPYLRAVNDSAFTFHYQYTKWGWRTNGYSISEIDEMLIWSSESSSADGNYKKFVTDVKNQIGDLHNLDIARDPSGRVKQITLYGSKGNAKMAGWLFKSLWNIWVGTEEPKGEKDYIYSLTYYFSRK